MKRKSRNKKQLDTTSQERLEHQGSNRESSAQILISSESRRSRNCTQLRPMAKKPTESSKPHKMTIKCSLEENRVQELDHLLTLLHPEIVQYVASADPSSEHYKQDSLGTYHQPQALKKIFASDEHMFENGLEGNSQKLMGTIENILKYSVNTWSPGFLDKLYASNNPIGVVSDIVLSLLNTNSHVYTVSPVVSVIENYIGKKYASLFFHDAAKCGGLTFSGGSWSNITAMHMARSLRFPDTKTEGNSHYRFAVFTSEHCHYSVEKAAILLGIGSSSVFKVPVNADGSMNTSMLEQTIDRAVKEGYTPLFINATAGTTVFGSFDDFATIGRIAKQRNIWFHVDGSWGGNVVFSNTQARRLEGCEIADSITANPHKMLGVPTTCSFLLVPDVRDFQKANSLSAPYLFHGRDSDEENMDLADGTMGCGRRADALKLYMAWLYYGSVGLQQRVDHAYAIVRDVVHKMRKRSGFRLVDENPQCLQVCFYYVPPGYVGENYTAVTRYVSRELHSRGRYLMDFSPNPSDDRHGEFFRVVFNSPILTDKIIDELLQSIEEVAEAGQY